jgi:hypothetical protein
MDDDSIGPPAATINAVGNCTAVGKGVIALPACQPLPGTA